MKAVGFWATATVGLLALAAIGLNSECRSWTRAAWARLDAWSQDTRDSDPREEGGAMVESLRQDLARLESMRGELHREQTALAHKRRKQEIWLRETESRLAELAEWERLEEGAGEEEGAALAVTLRRQADDQAKACEELERMEAEIAQRLAGLTLRMADTHAQIAVLEQLAEGASPAVETARLLNRADGLLREELRAVPVASRQPTGRCGKNRAPMYAQY